MKKHAFPLQLAQEAILLGRYSDAIELLSPLSEDDNNPEAQFLHAYLHFWDDNLSREQALDHMTYLANSGHAEANYILATCPDLSPSYQFSLPQRSEQLKHLKTAADLGSVYALTDLAQCYIKGLVTNPDLVKARQLLDQATKRMSPRAGYAKTHFLLGVMQIGGLGGEVETSEGLQKFPLCGYGQLKNTLMMKGVISFGIDVLKKTEVNCVHPFNRTRHRRSLNRWIEQFEKLGDEEDIPGNPQWRSFLHVRENPFYDLQDADFDTYTGFVFDHNSYEYRRIEGMRCNFNARELLAYYIKLFQNPTCLLERYSVEQIKMGLELLNTRSIHHHWMASSLMENPHLNTTLEDTLTCIRSMASLFEHLFHKPEFADVGHKWWGFFAIGLSWTGKYTKEEGAIISQIHFETVVEVLMMNSLDCQKSAISGISWIKHPEKEAVLRQYLDDNPEHPAWIREYAEAAIEGKIL